MSNSVFLSAVTVILISSVSVVDLNDKVATHVRISPKIKIVLFMVFDFDSCSSPVSDDHRCLGGSTDCLLPTAYYFLPHHAYYSKHCQLVQCVPFLFNCVLNHTKTLSPISCMNFGS